MSNDRVESRPWRYKLCLVLAALLSFALAGCGTGEQEKVTVHGKVTDNGQPVSVDQNTGLAWVEFHRIEGEQVVDSPNATIGQDGTYSAEVPPGEYRISVNKQPTYPGPNQYANIFPEGGAPPEIEITEDRELNIEVNDYRK